MNDARSPGAGSGWVASAISTAFTPPTGTAIAASAVGYTVGTIAQVGTATYTRRQYPLTPVVVMSGVLSGPALDRSREMGAAESIEKLGLVTRIPELVERYRHTAA